MRKFLLFLSGTSSQAETYASRPHIYRPECERGLQRQNSRRALLCPDIITSRYITSRYFFSDG
jgi:hypothetical protein